MLRLRPYKSCDADKIVTWLSDEVSFRKWCADRMPYPLTAEELDAYYKKEAFDDACWPMVVFDETGVVGHFTMRLTGKEKKCVRLGFIIVDCEKRGKGYGRELLLLAKQYAFDLLRVETIDLVVFHNNPNAKKCYESVGFKESGESGTFETLGETWTRIGMKLSHANKSFK